MNQTGPLPTFESFVANRVSEASKTTWHCEIYAGSLRQFLEKNHALGTGEEIDLGQKSVFYTGISFLAVVDKELAQSLIPEDERNSAWEGGDKYRGKMVPLKPKGVEYFCSMLGDQLGSPRIKFVTEESETAALVKQMGGKVIGPGY